MSYAGFGDKDGGGGGGQDPWLSLLQTGLQAAPGIIGAVTGHVVATPGAVPGPVVAAPPPIPAPNYTPVLLIGGVVVLGLAILMLGRRPAPAPA